MTSQITAIGDAEDTKPTFDSLALSDATRGALRTMGYVHPTPVQMAVLEAAATGRHLVVQARTGTGKTLGFGLPLLDRLIKPELKKAQAMVLTPTRELALQITTELAPIAKAHGIRAVAVYGGASMEAQIAEFDKGAQLVVATPGRVLDHLRRGTLDPSSIKMVVLDEADEMLSMGFAKDLHAIFEKLPRERQGLLFSATLPSDIERLAKSQLPGAEFITLSSDQVGALQISHAMYHIRGDKRRALLKIIDAEKPESAIVFCNTKDETERVATFLQAQGFASDWLNGDLSQPERERVMKATREERIRFLVATDVAARGIDISHLTHVINYDFPDSAESYVHRTGRTGRAGRTGTALSLVEPAHIGSLYLLRLTYKLRPVERELPTDEELQARASADLLSTLVEGYGERKPSAEALGLAARLATHEQYAAIVASMLEERFPSLAVAVEDVTRRSRAKLAPSPEAEERPRPAQRARRAGGDDRAPRHEERPSQEARAPRQERAPRDMNETGATRDSGPTLAPREERPSQEARAPRERAPRRPREERAPAEAAATPTRPEAQVFLDIGTRQGLTRAHVVDVLTRAGLPADALGQARIRDDMSFVAVAESDTDKAIEALASWEFAGKSVRAERARVR